MTVTSSTTTTTTPPNLVNLTIDGVPVSVPKGTLLIRAAEEIGIEIPRFCDHPLLEPVGACRQCMVEVATPGPDGSLRPMPKPQASCAVAVSEGMQVKSQYTSPVADKAQQGVMELLLINHPLDCPVCDKGGECPLQNQAMSSGRPESRFERGQGKLLEVYEGIVAPTGQRLLFEAYQRYSAISSQSKRLWSAFLPALIGAMVLLELLQMPLAISLARRLKRGALEREQLMRRAIDASSRERRRIARDLHDGPVQGLAGVSYSLAAAGGRIGSLDSAAGKLVDTAGVDTRRAITQLRSLLVELYPPTLSSEGLRAAVSDLAAPLSARNIKVEIDVPEDLDVDEDVEAVLFRSAQEALRNIAAHAHASAVQLGVRSEAGYVVLAISDDGRGFDMHVQSPEGHLGLTLVADLVSEAGGELSVDSHPGGGTSVTVVIPS